MLSGVTRSAGYTTTSKKTLLSASFACVALKKHQGYDYHREAVNFFVVLPQCTKDVDELQSPEHQADKAQNAVVGRLAELAG